MLVFERSGRLSRPRSPAHHVDGGSIAEIFVGRSGLGEGIKLYVGENLPDA